MLHDELLYRTVLVISIVVGGYGDVRFDDGIGQKRHRASFGATLGTYIRE